MTRMARQKLSQRKVRRLARELDLPIVHVLVRGGTDHRKDLCMVGGKVIHLYKDGTMEESEIGWKQQKS